MGLSGSLYWARILAASGGSTAVDEPNDNTLGGHVAFYFEKLRKRLDNGISTGIEAS